MNIINKTNNTKCENLITGNSYSGRDLIVRSIKDYFEDVFGIEHAQEILKMAEIITALERKSKPRGSGGLEKIVKSSRNKTLTNKALTNKAPTNKAPTNKAPTNKAPTNKASTNKASRNKASTNKASTNKASRNKTPKERLKNSYDVSRRLRRKVNALEGNIKALKGNVAELELINFEKEKLLLESYPNFDHLNLSASISHSRQHRLIVIKMPGSRMHLKLTYFDWGKILESLRPNMERTVEGKILLAAINISNSRSQKVPITVDFIKLTFLCSLVPGCEQKLNTCIDVLIDDLSKLPYRTVKCYWYLKFLAPESESGLKYWALL